MLRAGDLRTRCSRLSPGLGSGYSFIMSELEDFTLRTFETWCFLLWLGHAFCCMLHFLTNGTNSYIELSRDEHLDHQDHQDLLESYLEALYFSMSLLLSGSNPKPQLNNVE